MYFVFAAAADLVATEDLSTDEPAKSISEGAVVDIAFDIDGDDSAWAPQTVTFAAAITAVVTLPMCLGSKELDKNFGSQLVATER